MPTWHCVFSFSPYDATKQAVTVGKEWLSKQTMQEEKKKFISGNLQAQKLGLNLSYFRGAECIVSI